MTDFFRDPILYAITGSLIGLFAIIVAVAIYLLQRTRKALQYEVRSFLPLVNTGNKNEEKLKILFDGKLVLGAYWAVVRIINSGNVPIESRDFDRPVMISLGEKTRILSTEIAGTDPDNLQPSVIIHGTKIELMPLLLNGGDWIEIQVLASEPEHMPKVEGRVVGVRQIKLSGGERNATVFRLLLALFIALQLIFLSIVLAFPAYSIALVSGYAISVIAFLLVSVINRGLFSWKLPTST